MHGTLRTHIILFADVGVCAVILLFHPRVDTMKTTCYLRFIVSCAVPLCL